MIELKNKISSYKTIYAILCCNYMIVLSRKLFVKKYSYYFFITVYCITLRPNF